MSEPAKSAFYLNQAHGNELQAQAADFRLEPANNDGFWLRLSEIPDHFFTDTSPETIAKAADLAHALSQQLSQTNLVASLAAAREKYYPNNMLAASVDETKSAFLQLLDATSFALDQYHQVLNTVARMSVQFLTAFDAFANDPATQERLQQLKRTNPLIETLSNMVHELEQRTDLSSSDLDSKIEPVISMLTNEVVKELVPEKLATYGHYLDQILKFGQKLEADAQTVQDFIRNILPPN